MEESEVLLKFLVLIFFKGRRPELEHIVFDLEYIGKCMGLSVESV